LRGRAHSPARPRDREALVAAVDANALNLRGLVVDEAVIRVDSLLDAWEIAGSIRSDKSAEAIELLTDLAEWVMTRRVPAPAYIETHVDVAAALRELERLRNATLADFASLAKFFAVAGASQLEIAGAFGSATGEYGFRPALAAWRRFGKPAITDRGRPLAITHSLAAAARLSRRDGDVTRILTEYLNHPSRQNVFPDAVPRGVRRYRLAGASDHRLRP
jgi:hypothetical protein